jgi:hypothetical protein
LEGEDSGLLLIVDLNPYECSVVSFLAEKRQNKVKHKISDKSQAAIDIEGVGGEFAFYKAFNIYPDFDIDPREYDAMLPSGVSVDVKTTVYKRGKLIGEKKKIDYATDIYFLIIVLLPYRQFETIGWATKEELFDKANYGDHFGRGKCYAIPQEKLRNEQELWKYLNS